MNEVVVNGRRLPVPASVVRRIVGSVLDAERRQARMSVTFLGRVAMRKMNAEYKGHDYPTDVLTFALQDPTGGIVGDVYICPWVAAREARALGITPRAELLRLIVHGTLHAIGYDHPEGPGRTRSAMWRRQERYLEAFA